MAATHTRETSGPNTNVLKISIPWTSDGSGNYTEVIDVPAGWIIQAEFIPGATTPTDQYDVTFPSVATSFDALCGVGANALAASTTRKCPGITISDGTNNAAVPPFVKGQHTLTVANAGASKTGTVNIWVRN